jgi:hypothetical protein
MSALMVNTRDGRERDTELKEGWREDGVDRSVSQSQVLDTLFRPQLTPLLSFMDASQFSRWTRFAKKGGIGRCVALKNCAAEHPGDLMFFEVNAFLFLSLFFHSRRLERAMKSPF